MAEPSARDGPPHDGLPVASGSYWLMRIGSVGAILGAGDTGVGHFLHPVLPRGDPAAVAAAIAHSQHWTLIHLLISAGVFLTLAGLLGIQHSITTEGLTGALTRLGLWAATIGTTISLITDVLDGVAIKQLADQWALAPEPSKPIALGLVSATETIDFALTTFTMSFAGVTFVLFGIAVIRSGRYPRSLGWVALAAGIGSLGAGLVQAVTGEPSTTTVLLTIIGTTVIALWILAMGTLLWRRASAVPLNPPRLPRPPVHRGRALTDDPGSPA